MARSTRRRMGGGPGPGQWLALGGAVLVMLGLTFALGLLVGRQWARHSASAAVSSVSEAARRAAATPRRGGITAEVMADRAPESTEKLTFYHTLTEPLNGPVATPRPEAKPIAIKAPGASPAAPAPTAISLPPLAAKSSPDGKTGEAKTKTADGNTADGKTADGGSAAAISGPPQMNNASASTPQAGPKATASASTAGAPTPPWTIQVGAYKSRRQAEDTRQQLAAAGLDAYVASVAAQDGHARFRVRVGTYRTREEAATAADRIHAQRSLTTFVTPK
ncbi:MAG TPA: SPOR domain-containing protein [Methylomirabilota bacterium]|nr:SPOR domain-containing protein [Methylomirabilota bacterium]